MTTLHILLASGENLPNLIPALDPGFKADTALILTSKRMRGRAQTLKVALEFAGVRNARIQQEDCPDHDLSEMRQWARTKADEIVGNHYDNRRILNLTGGNKLMTIAFLEAFQGGKTEIIYCDTEHNHIESIRDDKPALPLPVNLLKLDAYLAAQGYKLRPDETDVQGIKTRAELTRKLVAAAPRINGLIQAFNTAAFGYDKNASGTVWTDNLNPEEKHLLVDTQQLHLLVGGELREAEAARYLGGGWLEEWCWLVGEELEQEESGQRLHRKRWGISQKIDPFGNVHATQYPLNELDAVFVHRNRMLLIECKTGRQISDRDESQQILNKLDALGDQFGGRLSTRWLLTARTISSNRQAMERARRYGIHIVEPQKLIHLKEKVQEWMTR